jgi:hypothetical protein
MPSSNDLNKPLISGGVTFRTHNLYINGNVAYLKPTRRTICTNIAFLMLGIFFLVSVFIILYFQEASGDTALVGAVMFMFISGLVTTCMMLPEVIRNIKNANFNKETGEFVSYFRDPVKLDSIVSLQVIEKTVRLMKAPDYLCYELNVVTKDGKRVNVLNHNDLPKIIEDWQQLRRFLGKTEENMWHIELVSFSR